MDSLETTRVAFLVYVNRSGSTFLASRMAALPGVVVTLESEAIGQLLQPTDSVGDAGALAQVLDGLYAELKFRQWEIARDGLERALAAQDFPLSRETIFLTILRALPGGGDATCFLVKAPRMLRVLPPLMDRYRDLKVIHVVRDPRAVYASQRKTISSRTGHSMVRDPVTMGRRWRQGIRDVDRLPAGAVCHVRYEELLAQERTCVHKLADFLGLEARPGDSAAPGADYAARIPGTQRHLHEKVGQAADVSRIEGWRRELRAAEVSLLEDFSGPELQRFGYRPEPRAGLPEMCAMLPRVALGIFRDTVARGARYLNSLIPSRE